jgi:hypothetical protein
MNWTCPRILYFTDFGPHTERNLSFSTTLFFYTPHDLLALYDWPALSMRFPPLFFHRCALAVRWSTWPLVGALDHLCCWPVGAPFFILYGPPFFSFLLTTMPHGSNSVMTSLHCVGSPSVAVLCESDCPSSVCVVQSERKKKKRVSVIVGNDHQLSPFNDYHSPPFHDYHLPPSHDHHSPPTNAIQSRTNANQSPTNANQSPTNAHQSPTSNHHKKPPINDHQLPSLPSSNDPRSPSKDPLTNALQSPTKALQSPTCNHHTVRLECIRGCHPRTQEFPRHVIYRWTRRLASAIIISSNSGKRMFENQKCINAMLKFNSI